ncbi:MAG: hypothetical protein D6767_08955 [Candidatus Hydrogenedentota bacterium]|nr:MAG: hypothetical protein D6767_08955 [Candidatus Hydrogenedentota bacterium]
MGMLSNREKIFVSVAGFDNTSGAGILLDARVAQSLKQNFFSVSSCVTSQSFFASKKHIKMQVIDRTLFVDQLKTIQANQIMAIKIGLMPSVDLAKDLVGFLKKWQKHESFPVVLDPIYSATLGKNFIPQKQYLKIQQILLPHVQVITPNKREWALLKKLAFKQTPSVVVTDADDASTTIHHFLYEGGTLKAQFEMPKLEFSVIRGTGCAFSSALAIFLAKGINMLPANKKAAKHVQRGINKGVSINGIRYLHWN